jgi:hypothetical protein
VTENASGLAQQARKLSHALDRFETDSGGPKGSPHTTTDD